MNPACKPGFLWAMIFQFTIPQNSDMQPQPLGLLLPTLGGSAE